MTTQLPVGLKRRVNLVVATNLPEEDVNDEYDFRVDFVVEPRPHTRSQSLDIPLNTREKLIFAAFSVVVFFGQILMDFYFWNQTKSKILLFWGGHQVTLLVISLLIMFKTKFTMTLFGPRRTMYSFDYLVEYEKVSAIVYHSFQAGQVFYNYFARGIFGAESVYHAVTFICVFAYLCKKYNLVF
jgi:hypothetical protein